MSPSTRADGMVSFMRLRQRKNVDLPQPDGPIMRQHLIAPDVEAHVLDCVLVAVMNVHTARRHHGIAQLSRAAGAGCSSVSCVIVHQPKRPVM